MGENRNLLVARSCIAEARAKMESDATGLRSAMHSLQLANESAEAAIEEAKTDEEYARAEKVISDCFFEQGRVNRKLNQPTEARSAYYRSLELDPDPATYYNIGLMELELNRVNDAYPAFEMAEFLGGVTQAGLDATKRLMEMRHRDSTLSQRPFAQPLGDPTVVQELARRHPAWGCSPSVVERHVGYRVRAKRMEAAFALSLFFVRHDFQSRGVLDKFWTPEQWESGFRRYMQGVQSREDAEKLAADLSGWPELAAFASLTALELRKKENETRTRLVEDLAAPLLVALSQAGLPAQVEAVLERMNTNERKSPFLHEHPVWRQLREEGERTLRELRRIEGEKIRAQQEKIRAQQEEDRKQEVLSEQRRVQGKCLDCGEPLNWYLKLKGSLMCLGCTKKVMRG